MSTQSGANGNGTSIPKRRLTRVRRIVVKVGSAVIAGRGRLRPRVIADLAYDVTHLRHQGYDVIMVVSGAVAAGFAHMGLSAPPAAVVERQAAASIGQPRLMNVLAQAFARQRVHVAQLLMTAWDIEDRRRFLSARHTMQTLLAHGVVPIINENDALSDDETKVGDNDHLAALVTNLVSAQLLVVLSQVQGLHADGGAGPLIPEVGADEAIEHHIGGMTSETGVGGMAAKVRAARLASHWGVPTIIACGTQPGLLPRVVAGEPIGTLFMPREHNLTSRKKWIAVRARSRGVIVVDAGARRAIAESGASLLPSGITGVRGRFPMGARVELQGPNGKAFAVGLVSYNSDEIRRLQGRKLKEFKEVLGYEYVKEIINRDDLVVLPA